MGKNLVFPHSWAHGLAHRTEGIQIRTAIEFEKDRIAAQTQQKLRPFFATFKHLLESGYYCPPLLFNLDETPVRITERKKAKVFTPLASPTPMRIRPPRIKNATLLFTISAVGEHLRTQLLWPSSKIPKGLGGLNLFSIRVVANKSGWQTKNSFIEFVVPLMDEMCVIRRNLNLEDHYILLLCDSHSSRLSSKFIVEARNRHITIITIPPHSSAVTQPCDRFINANFQATFNAQVRKMTLEPSLISPLSPLRQASVIRPMWKDVIKEAGMILSKSKDIGKTMPEDSGFSSSD
jgi:hypothetical protein